MAWADELLALCEAHRMKGSCQRKNVADPASEPVEYRTKGGHKAVFLRKPVPSETLRSGPIFDAVKAHLPDTQAVCYNRNLQAFPHRDSRNAGCSHLLFLGTFEGGALVTEHGDRYEQRGVWMGPFDFRKVTHWNEPILSGTKHSLIAFSNHRIRQECKSLEQKPAIPDTLPVECADEGHGGGPATGS